MYCQTLILSNPTWLGTPVRKLWVLPKSENYISFFIFRYCDIVLEYSSRSTLQNGRLSCLRQRRFSSLISATAGWSDNTGTWSCYTEADFSKHDLTDPRSQFLTVVKTVPRDFNRYFTFSMFVGDVAEAYKTFKKAIFECEDLTERRRLDQLINNIELQHGLATETLLWVGEVVGQRACVKQLFLPRLLRQVQVVLV